jgi:5-methyltetrahydrofolate--homocysteine methyltransferase
VALSDWVKPVAADCIRHAKSSSPIAKEKWGSLPHWYRDGATYAVTFRLEDSFPKSVLVTYAKEKEELKLRISLAEKEGDESLAKDLRKALDKLYRERIENVLDAGLGESWMKDARIAEIVAGAITHFAGERYDLGAWCVMPNHVHMILAPKEGESLAEILHSIKRFSAREANKILGREGSFWQKESYDHIIRDGEEFAAQTRYVLGNPEAAGLVNWEFLGDGGLAGRMQSAATFADYLGGFVVGIHGADEYAKELDDANDPYGSIMVKAIADRLAEACAEKLHHEARIAWGFEAEGELTTEALIHEKYQGIRPAPGYPAQPDHTEKPILFDLLGASAETGVILTESCAMHPGAAVSGMFYSHPDSHYFAVSDLQKDQVEDYARRKGMSLEEAEKWLGPWLGYAN